MQDIDSFPRIPLEKLKTFKGRCETLYKIQTKQGDTRNFIFLESQDFFDKIVSHEFKRTKREFGFAFCKLICVKPRQVGWTTYSNIKSLDMQIQDQGSNGVIAAHDKDTTELVYRIYQRAYDELPEYVVPTLNGEEMTKRMFFQQNMGVEEFNDFVDRLIDQEGESEANNILDQLHTIKIKPDTKSHSGKQIEFIDNDSITVIFTAGKGDAGGKAGTLRRVHFTECANYPEYKKLMTSIGPAVPKSADGVFFILESTANGTTGDGEGFYNAWTNSVKEWERYQQGKNQTFGGFRPVFIPWYMIEEYERPLVGGKYESIEGIKFSSPEEKRNFLEREQTLLNEGIYNPLTQTKQIVTPEKINWYRWIIKTDLEFEYRDAQRYYPTTPEDAFVASTDTFFDSMKLNERKSKLINDPQEYELGEVEWDDATGDLTFRASSVGNLKIFEPPQKGWYNRYVIGADLGRGYEDGDYSCAYIFDRLEQKYVAIWHGKEDQDRFAETLMELGIYYNEALLIPESNLDTVVNIIKPDGSRPYIGEVYYEEFASSVRYGYLTTKSSRQILIDSQKGWLRDNPKGYDVLPDVETVDEYLAFVRKRTQHGVKYEADEGHFDDRVIGSSLAKFGDDWWDEKVKEDKPNKLVELISKPNKTIRKHIRASALGRKKK